MTVLMKPIDFSSLLLLLLATIVGTAATNRVLGAESVEQRFMAGLRERRLYRLAETYGNQQLRRDDLSEQERAQLVISLIEMFTQQALDLASEHRPDVWQKAEALLAAEYDGWPAGSRRTLVEVQHGLMLLARGNLERLESSGTAGEQAGIAAAQDHLRDAIRRLAAAAEAVQQTLADRALRSGMPGAPDGLTSAELESLDRHLDFHVGRAYRNQALCYPAGSADRDNSLLLALDRQQRLAKQLADDPLTWKARVEHIKLLRHLQRLDETERLLSVWEQESPPPGVRAELAAERVRLLLARAEIKQALDAISTAETTVGENSDELSLAHLEVLVAAWRQSAGDGESPQSPAGKWAERIASQLANIRRQSAPSTVRRAQVLAGRAFAASKRSPTSDALVLAAENLYHSGRFDEALEAYDRAAAELARSGAHDRAFELEFTAATIERNRHRYQAAGQRYRQLALAFSAHPKAAAAHQLGVLSQTELARSAPSDQQSEELAAYRQMLKEHLLHWPQSPTANDARWWMAALAMTDHRWADALDALQAIKPSHQRYPDAVDAASRCYTKRLDQLAADDENSQSHRHELLARARQFLQPAITGPDNRWPQTWSKLQLDVAARLAALHVHDAAAGSNTSDYAVRLLQAAIHGTDSVESRARLSPLLVVALAQQGRFDEAAETLRQFKPDASAQVLMDCLAQLSRQLESADTGSPGNQSGHGKLMLAVVERMQSMPDQLDDAQQRILARHHAEALAAAGRTSDALQLYKQLVQLHPNDGDIQEAYAVLLSRTEGPEDLRTALERWTEVERRSSRGGSRWSRARKARIALLRRLGETQQATKLEQLSRLLYPADSAAARAEREPHSKAPAEP